MQVNTEAADQDACKQISWDIQLRCKLNVLFYMPDRVCWSTLLIIWTRSTQRMQTSTKADHIIISNDIICNDIFILFIFTRGHGGHHIF